MSISSLTKHLSKKICGRCSRRKNKEPFRATHVCSCVVVIANTSRDRRIRAEKLAVENIMVSISKYYSLMKLLIISSHSTSSEL